MKKVTIDSNSLAHTKWECKYHIVFAPKYRRKVFYDIISIDIYHFRCLCNFLIFVIHIKKVNVYLYGAFTLILFFDFK